MQKQYFLIFFFILTTTLIFSFAAQTTNWTAEETLKEINAKLLGNSTTTPTPASTTTPIDSKNTNSILIREKNISAECINKILQENSSPAAGSGEVWINSAKKYGIDPAVGLSFFRKESTFGKFGYANTNKSIGNRMDSKGNFIKYNSWEESIDDWFNYMQRKYTSVGDTTIEKIIPIYAPPETNNTALYIKQLNEFIALYRGYEGKNC